MGREMKTSMEKCISVLYSDGVLNTVTRSQGKRMGVPRSAVPGLALS